jgi:cell fate regulator YaaT (PSP1 superfamily)
MMDTPIDNRRIIEVNCKGMLGCHFAEISSQLETLPEIGDRVILSDEDYYEIGIVKENSELIKIKRAELGLYGEKLPQVIRIADQNDIQKYNKNLLDEVHAKPIFFKLVAKHDLNMKLVHIHYQFDRKRLFFFYTSDGRVDFRELAKDLASEFKTRIELRQMGVRDEAKNIGGLGTCGREFCCSSFLNNFKRISTQLANDQNLNTNLSKLSGPCGKLKCCISFEIDEN